MSAVLVNGFFVGLIYGLIAVGLVTLYRGSRVIHFAYGETGMVAAFVFADIRYGTGASTIIMRDNGILKALPVAVVVGAVVCAATELLVIRPLRHAPRIRPAVGTLAVGALLFVYASRRWGPTVRFAKPLVEGSGVKLGGLRIQPQQLLVLGVTVVLLVALWAVNRFTSFGLRSRATAIDPYGAALVGVNVDATSLVTWAIAGGIAGLSAVLVAPLATFDIFFMSLLLVRSLAAALVGGLTSVVGAVIAGVGLGMAEAFVSYKSPVAGMADAFVAVLVLVLVLARPQGLIRSAY